MGVVVHIKCIGSYLGEVAILNTKQVENEGRTKASPNFCFLSVTRPHFVIGSRTRITGRQIRADK